MLSVIEHGAHHPETAITSAPAELSLYQIATPTGCGATACFFALHLRKADADMLWMILLVNAVRREI
jgi:hypothetical protein